MVCRGVVHPKDPVEDGGWQIEEGRVGLSDRNFIDLGDHIPLRPEKSP